MNSVVACPMIPEVKVLAKVHQPDPVPVQPAHLPGLVAIDLEARDQRHYPS